MKKAPCVYALEKPTQETTPSPEAGESIIAGLHDEIKKEEKYG